MSVVYRAIHQACCNSLFFTSTIYSYSKSDFLEFLNILQDHICFQIVCTILKDCPVDFWIIMNDSNILHIDICLNLFHNVQPLNYIW